MPPAITSKAPRPASIYSEGLSSAVKKRASISPSASASTSTSSSSTLVGMASSSSSSSSLLNTASRTSFKREREGSVASSSSSSSFSHAQASAPSNTIPIINTMQYASSASYYPSQPQQHASASSSSQARSTQPPPPPQPQQVAYNVHSQQGGGPPRLPPIASSSSGFSITTSSPMKVDALGVTTNAANGRGGLAPQSQAQAPAKTKSSTLIQGSGSVVTKENRLLFEDDYAGEVVEYMLEMEVITGASADLMDMQPELQWYMRPFLVDFLVEIHQQFRLRPEVLYLSLNIVDRYVSKRVVYKKHYQLVGCAALWIASKFEDAKDRVPTVRELADMCCKAYDETAFIQMEGHVLQTIGWTIGHPTAEAWLRLACMGNVREDTRTQHVARFVMEITLFHREFVGCKPSSVAAAALMLARFVCGLPRKPSTGDSEEIMRIIQCLDVCFHDHLSEISQIVIDKYAPIYYSRASSVVKDWYSSGKRYVYLVMPAPISPASSSGMITPGLVPSWSARSGSRYGSSPNGSGPFSASSSEAGDDMPRTPVTPVGYNAASDPFLVAATAAGVTSAHVQSFRDFKENVAPANTGYAHPSVNNFVPTAEVVGAKKHMAQGGPVAAIAGGAHQPQRMALNPVQPNANTGAAPVFPRTLRRLSN